MLSYKSLYIYIVLLKNNFIKQNSKKFLFLFKCSLYIKLQFKIKK